MPEENSQSVNQGPSPGGNSPEGRNWGEIPEMIRMDTLDVNAEGEKILVDYIRHRKDAAYSKRSASVFPGARHIADARDWIKFHPAGSDPVKVLKRFLGNFSLMIYPLILMDKDSVKIQLKLISEFSDEDMPAKETIRELRNLNRGNIIKYFEWRAKNPRKIPADCESEPGRIIKDSLDYTLLSSAQDLVEECLEELRVILKLQNSEELPVQKKNLDLLKNDFIYSTENLLNPVLVELHKDLHLAAHEGLNPGTAFIAHDEAVYVYRIMGDIAEKQIFQLADKMKKQGYDLLSKDLDEYNLANPPVPGKRQNRKRLLGLIAVSQNYIKKINPPGQWLIDLTEFLAAFSSVCAELDKEFSKEADLKIIAKVNELAELIKKQSGEKGLLVKLNYKKIFKETDFTEPGTADRCSDEVLSRLMQDQDLCWHRMDNGEDVYFAWMVFFLKVESRAEKNKRKNPEEYAAVQAIKGNLPQTHPENHDYHALLEDYSRKSNVNHYQMAVYEIKEAKIAEQYEQKKWESEFKINHPAGFALGTIAGLIGIAAGFGLSLLFGLVAPLGAAITGISFFLGGYFFGRSYFSTEKEKERETQRSIEVRDQKNKSGEKSAKEKENPLHKIAEQTFPVIFPDEFDSYMDRVYTAKSLEEAVSENIETLKKQIPKIENETDEKAVSELVFAVKNHPDTAQIIVPTNYAVQGYPDSIIVKKTDLKSDAARKQIADYYLDLFHNRDAMLVRKNPQLAGYYRFFINTFETSEYRKYL